MPDVKLGLSRYGKKITLRMFENMVPRKIFKPKRKEVEGGWRKTYNI